MEHIDLDVNSYRTCELLDFFGLHGGASEQDLVESYRRKRTQCEEIYDRSQRVAFETFLNDAFDLVREKLVKRPPPVELPKRTNANSPPTESLQSEFLLTIDSTFRKNKDSSTSTDFVIDLPMIFDRVTQLELVATEIPLTSYNFASSKDNHQFTISLYEDDTDEAFETHTITIPDGAWYSTELIDYMSEVLSEGNLAYFVFNIDDQSGHSMFRFKTDDELTDDDISSGRSFNRYKVANVSTEVEFEESCLFVFGFLESDVSDIITSESTFDYAVYTYTGVLESTSIFGVTFDDYYYIYMNDFVNNSMSHQIIGIQDEGYIGNNIIGRVEINSSAFNRNIGSSSYVVRKYPGQVRIRKLHVKILDKDGETIDNGYSNTVLLLRVTCEQSSQKYEQIV